MLASEFQGFILQSRWDNAQKTTDWLTKQLGDLQSKLIHSEKELQTYSQRIGILFTDEQNQNTEQDKLAQLQEEMLRAQADRAAKQSTFDVARSNSADTVPQILDNGRLNEYRTRLAELRQQLAELTSMYTAEHPRVVRVKAQISEMQSTLERERANIIARIRNDYEAAQGRERLLTGAYRAQLGRVADQAGKAVQYNMLKREVETNRQVYDALLQKAKVVGMGSAMSASNMRVLDAAELPDSPVSPNLPRNIALGLMSGLMLGVGFVLAGHYVNRYLQAPGETAFHLKVPELGVIPAQTSVGPGKANKLSAMLRGGENGGNQVELVSWQDRPSVLAESFRSTLASLLVSNVGKERPRVIMVTSSGRGDGKSSVVSNLGIALAEINQRVLLIDADLRKPHLHEIFNIPNSWGLSDLLRERAPLDGCPVQALAKSVEVEGLHVLTSGPGTASIANLLYSRRMGDLLERLRQEFDMVLIDTPPMSYFADARVLGRHADGAVLVVRADKTTRDDAMIAKQRLADDGILVLGTILNGWDLKAKARYGYSTYSYRYQEA
jgi:capsular exopolysaccharide synthesis family protein